MTPTKKTRTDAGTRNRIALIALVVMIGIVLAGGYFLSTLVVPDNATPVAPGADSAPAVGSPAPDIRVQQLERDSAGTYVSLSSLRGHPVILNFWATWCQPCLAELPALDAVYRKYKESSGLQVIGVNVQDGSTPAQISTYIRGLGVTFPIWLSGAADYNVESTYKIQAMPTTAFIDRSGIIRQIHIGGPMTQTYLEQQLDKITKE